MSPEAVRAGILREARTAEAELRRFVEACYNAQLERTTRAILSRLRG